jgi:hypothetical protein
MNRREFLKTLAGVLGVGAVASLLAQKKEPEVLPYRGCYFVPAFNDEYSHWKDLPTVSPSPILGLQHIEDLREWVNK